MSDVACCYLFSEIVTQYNKRYILSTFEKIEIFVLSDCRFNKLSNDTQFIKIEAIVLKSFTKCEFPFIFLIFYTLFCSLSQNKPGRQDVPCVVLGHNYCLSKVVMKKFQSWRLDIEL